MTRVLVTYLNHPSGEGALERRALVLADPKKGVRGSERVLVVRVQDDFRERSACVLEGMRGSRTPGGGRLERHVGRRTRQGRLALLLAALWACAVTWWCARSRGTTWP